MELTRFVDYVDKLDLQKIEEYLDKHPLGVNKYRKKVGVGQSNTMGIVSKRCMKPDICRLTWKHPELFKMLLDYAHKYVHIPFTSIQINVNYECLAHKDINNHGLSYIVGFGSYIGGSLCIEKMDYDIKLRGLLFDGSQHEHWTKNWLGDRYTLVFHSLAPLPRWQGYVPALCNYEVVKHDDIWKIKRLSDGALFWGKKGLEHPLKGRKRINQISPDTSPLSSE